MNVITASCRSLYITVAAPRWVLLGKGDVPLSPNALFYESCFYVWTRAIGSEPYIAWQGPLKDFYADNILIR